MKPVRTIPIAQNPRYFLEQNAKTLSNISFGATLSNSDQAINIKCWKATGTSPGTTDTEFSIAHNLDHVPIGFIIISKDKAGQLYKSTTAWTAATSSSQGAIYLKSNVASLGFTIIII